MGSKGRTRARAIPGKNTAADAAAKQRHKIRSAQAEAREMAEVAANEPAGSDMAAPLAELAAEARERYDRLCDEAGVCRVRNCTRPALGGLLRCKSHAPFYGKKHAAMN